MSQQDSESPKWYISKSLILINILGVASSILGFVAAAEAKADDDDDRSQLGYRLSLTSAILTALTTFVVDLKKYSDNKKEQNEVRREQVARDDLHDMSLKDFEKKAEEKLKAAVERANSEQELQRQLLLTEISILKVQLADQQKDREEVEKRLETHHAEKLAHVEAIRSLEKSHQKALSQASVTISSLVLAASEKAFVTRGILEAHQKRVKQVCLDAHGVTDVEIIRKQLNSSSIDTSNTALLIKECENRLVETISHTRTDPQYRDGSRESDA